jgi:hypothetical protein
LCLFMFTRRVDIQMSPHQVTNPAAMFLPVNSDMWMTCMNLL